MLVALLVTALAVLFLVVGCTSDDGAADEPTAAAAATTTEATTTTAAPTTTAATTTTTMEPAGPERFDEMEALIEAYLASWEPKDEAALRATVTDDFVIHEYIYRADTGTSYEVIDDDADGVVSKGFDYNWQNEIVGESVVTGNGPWTVRHRELWQQGGNRLDGIATFTVVDVDGTLKIARHSWAGFVWSELIEF
jgi:hypothetical protein